MNNTKETIQNAPQRRAGGESEDTLPMHTPAPWVFEGAYPNRTPGYSPLNKVTIVETGGMIAVYDDDLARGEANARLIATAPDMLNYLRDGAKMLGKLTGANLEAYARTFAVLAGALVDKAEGRS